MAAQGYARVLQNDRYHQIVAGLQNYRIDTFIQMLEKQKGSNVGKVLPFVRGLRFSALLIYAIREYLSHTNLTASWGHILDKDGAYCSRECDIIIHQKGFAGIWNGGGNGEPVMDFKFIEHENAVAVISCKSYLSRTAVEVDYGTEMKKYVDKVWLFAECCGPNSIDLIRQEALSHDYEHFWHLYTYNKASGETENNVDGWIDFVEKIKALKA